MTPETQKTVIRIISILAVTAIILAFNANDFDETEYRVLGWLGGFLGVGGIADIMTNKSKQPWQRCDSSTSTSSYSPFTTGTRQLFASSLALRWSRNLS